MKNKNALWIMAASISALSFGSATPALADRGAAGIGNGGSTTSLTFAATAQELLSDFEKGGVVPTGVSLVELQSTLAAAKIFPVTTPLFVTSENVQQRAVAVNEIIGQVPTISVNTDDWSSIQSDVLKKGIALHELLSLEGKESTGSYPMSSLYLAMNGVAPLVDTPANASELYTATVPVLPNEDDSEDNQLAPEINRAATRCSFELIKQYMAGLGYSGFKRIPYKPQDSSDLQGFGGAQATKREFTYQGEIRDIYTWDSVAVFRATAPNGKTEFFTADAEVEADDGNQTRTCDFPLNAVASDQDPLLVVWRGKHPYDDVSKLTPAFTLHGGLVQSAEDANADKESELAWEYRTDEEAVAAEKESEKTVIYVNVSGTITVVPGVDRSGSALPPSGNGL